MATDDVVIRFAADTSLLKRAAAGVGTLFAGLFAVKEAGDFINAAEEAQVASARLAQTLKNAGDTTGGFAKHAEDLAESLRKTTGIDDEIIKGGQAILATFHNVGGATGQASGAFDRATRAALDLSKAGFGDVDSAAKQLGKALQDPIKGITALNRAGVTFTDTQKKQIEQFVKAGDTAAAMNVVLSNVEDQVGGTAEATATATDKMSTAWGETQEALGGLILPLLDVLAPGLESLSESFNDTAVPAIKNFATALVDKLGPPVSTVIGWLRDDLLPAVTDVATTLAGWAASGAGAAVTWIRDSLIPAISDAVDWVQNKLIPALEHAATILGDKFGPSLKTAEDNLQTGFVPALSRAVDALRPVGRFLEDIGRALADRFGPALRDAGSSVADFVRFFADRFDKIKQAVTNVISAVRIALTGLGAVFAVVLTPIIILWQQFNDQIVAVVSFAWDLITNTISTGLRVIGDLFDVILNVLSGNWGDAWNAIADIPVAIFDGLHGVFNDFLSFVVNFFVSLPGNLAGAVGALLAFFVNLGGQILLFLEAPFIAAFQWVRDHVGDIPSALSAIPGLIAGVLEGVFDALTSPFVLAFNAIVDLWNNTVGRISFTIPDWVPFGIGGKSFSVPTLPHVGESGRVGGGGGLSLRLAEGGIVTSPTAALIGEAGAEAVIPLDRLAGLASTVVNVYVTHTGLGADSPKIGRDIAAALDEHTFRNGPLAASIVGI